MHCKIKKDNHQVPKSQENKIKNLQIMQVTDSINTEYTDS